MRNQVNYSFYDRTENQKEENANRTFKWYEENKNKKEGISRSKPTIIKNGRYRYISRNVSKEQELSYEDKVNEVLKEIGDIQGNVDNEINNEKVKAIMNQNYNQSAVNNVIETQRINDIINKYSGQSNVDHIIDEER